MAFLLFRRSIGSGSAILRNTGERFKLAGSGLLQRAWRDRGSPMREGWRASADDLIRIHTGGTESYESRRLLIDWFPSAKSTLGLIEILDVYAYTYGDSPGDVEWTPLMLRLRDVHYSRRGLAPAQKRRLFADGIQDPQGENEVIEFLYLQGRAGRWNWGRNGSTNAAFIQSGAREYFRQFF